MSQILAKSGPLEVCLPIVTGLGLIFALFVNLISLAPPPDIRDNPEKAQVEASLVEA